MSMKNGLVLGAIAFALFACDSQESACESKGCGSYHNEKYRDEGTKSVKGDVAVGERRIDATTGLRIEARANGTLDFFDDEEVPYVTPPWCAGDAGARDPHCEPQPPQKKERARAHLDIALPGDEDDYDLDEVGAELWYCASPSAELHPIATREGAIVPACFEEGKDHVDAVRIRLSGELVVEPPPVSLDDLRTEESGFAYRYRLTTDTSSAARVVLDVTAWHKHKLVSCGELY